MKIIGLAGKAGSGKDFVYLTIDRALHAHQAVRRMAFADRVKVEIEEVTNQGRNMIPLWTKPYSYEVRELLKWWGTDFRRAEDIDHWVTKSIPTFERLKQEGADVVCVTDVRFQNEVNFIHRMGGVVFEIVAKDYVRSERLNISEDEQRHLGTHATERIDLQHLDGVIDNNSFPRFPAHLNEYLGLPEGFQPERVADVQDLFDG